MRKHLLSGMLFCLLTPAYAQTEDVVRLVETYGAAWNEPAPDKRMELLRQVWTEDSVYMDPNTRVQGARALSDYIGDFQTQMGHARLVLEGPVQSHHDRARFAWKVVGTDGSVKLQGVDFGELRDGRFIAEIVGFFADQ